MEKTTECLRLYDGQRWRKAETKICQCCGLSFAAMVKELRKGNGKFCSRKCQRSHQALLNAAARKTVGLTASERKKQWLSKVSPLVVLAHRAVEYAIANKSLIRLPCEKCGSQKVDAHHDDYLKPLDVRWLCRRHHLEFHRPSGAVI